MESRSALVGALCLALLTGGCSFGGARKEANVSSVDVDAQRFVTQVVATYPHDPAAFTQGLELVDGNLWESTGEYGKSGVRQVDRSTGHTLRSGDTDPTWFGEGFTAIGDGLAIQLTWKAGQAVIWDLAGPTPVGAHTYEGQGWGLCRLDETTLVMSDGSETLTMRRLDDLSRVAGVRVLLDGKPLKYLNELECVDGTVWANVWLTDTIVAIDPSTGRVAGVVDASNLLTDRSSLGANDVLNGIAHDPDTGRFLLTGKRWPTLFEVVFVSAPDQPAR
ncbi:MAG: glutaminyl-peptide cyclotransferase [Acidimicrobiales bacterium]|nr:glutaminyl-peptide cyclotransferase [Acidimicrobiales bacterium]